MSSQDRTKVGREGEEAGTRCRGPFADLVVLLSRPLLVQGCGLPWSNWVLDRMSDAEKGLLQRERLSAEFRGADYRFKVGPLWLRRALEGARESWLRNRFWFSVAGKTMAGASLIVIPLAAFLVYRLFLPDPSVFVMSVSENRGMASRESSRGPRQNLYPYARKFDSPGVPSLGAGERLAGLSVLLDSGLEERLAEGTKGLSYVFAGRLGGLGPGSLEAKPAYLIGEEEELSLELQSSMQASDVSSEILGGNTLEGSFLLMSGSAKETRCRLELRDDAGQILFSVEKTIEPSASQFDAFGLSALRRLFGATESGQVPIWQSYSFDRDDLPRGLVYSLRRQAHGVPDGAVAGCSAVLSRPVFSKRKLGTVSSRRGVVVLVDGLSMRAFHELGGMVRLGELGAKGRSLPRHFSLASSVPDSFQHLLWGRQGASLLATARERGFKTAAFGEFSDFFGRDLPLKIEDLPEAFGEYRRPYYRAMGAALDYGSWLDTVGPGSFLALVRLSDLIHRLVPPWRDLNVSRFLRHPVGLEGRELRLEGMLRYMDEALGLIIDATQRAAHETGEPISLWVTAPRGLQTAPLLQAPYFHGAKSIVGASFEPAYDWMPDALHVPLIEVVLSPAGEVSPPDDALSADSFTDHRLLSERLKSFLRGEPPPPVVWEPLFLDASPSHVAVLEFPQEGSAVHHWLYGREALPGRIFSKELPFVYERPQDVIPVQSGAYDLGARSYRDLLDKDALWLEKRALESLARHQSSERQLNLWFSGPGTWHGQVRAAGAATVERWVSGERGTDESDRAVSFERGEDREGLTVALGRGELVRVALPWNTQTSTLELAGNGDYALCGRTLTTGGLQLGRGQTETVFQAPPVCALESGFRWSGEPANAGVPRGPRVDVEVGWTW